MAPSVVVLEGKRRKVSETVSQSINQSVIQIVVGHSVSQTDTQMVS